MHKQFLIKICIPKVLGIKYPPNDVEPILNIILNGKEEQRIHAIEFLDNILDNQLKKELIPIAESILVEVIEDLEISQKEWVEYDDNEYPNCLCSVRSDFYLKHKEDYK